MRMGMRHPPAVGEAIEPDTVPDLLLWYKADSLALDDGDPVAEWVDSSGNGHDLSQSTGSARPTYKAGIVNAQPVVRYDGVDDVLNLTQVNSAGGMALYLVARGVGGVWHRNLYGGGLIHNDPDPGRFTLWHPVGASAALSHLDLPASPADAFDLYVWEMRGFVAGRMHAPSTLLVPNHVIEPGNGTQTFARIGNGVAETGGFFAGDLAELVVVDRELTLREAAGIGRYLANKYQLPLLRAVA